jgi:hypothetical protein
VAPLPRLDGKSAGSCNPSPASRIHTLTMYKTFFLALAPGKKLSGNRAIERQVRENTNDNNSYWENYNAIEADFNVDSALAVIRRSNLVHHMQP